MAGTHAACLYRPILSFELLRPKKDDGEVGCVTITGVSPTQTTKITLGGVVATTFTVNSVTQITGSHRSQDGKDRDHHTAVTGTKFERNGLDLPGKCRSLFEGFPRRAARKVFHDHNRVDTVIFRIHPFVEPRAGRFRCDRFRIP